MQKDTTDATPAPPGTEPTTLDALGSRPPSLPVAPVELPTLQRPTGGGAIRSISERFAANSATGTGALRVDLGLSPGRNGFGPGLALGYDSGNGNGPFGLGWSVAVPSVHRKTSRSIPRYVDGLDDFVLAGGEDLLAVGAPQTITEGGVDYDVQRFRPRVERSFDRVERWRSRGTSHWRTYSASDVCSIYGRTSNARVADTSDPRRVFRWLLEEQWDGRGSAIHFVYKAEDLAGVDRSATHEAHRTGGPSGTRYLKRIRYGNATALADRGLPLSNPVAEARWRFEVVFDYGEHTTDTTHEVAPWRVRPDPFSTHRAGFELRTYRLVHRVLMFHRFPELGPGAEAEGHLVRSTALTYGRHEIRSGVTVVVDDPLASKLLRIEQTGHRDGSMASMPPTDFEYSAAQWSDRVRIVNRDAYGAVPGATSPAQWVDFDGEGLPGALHTTPEAWHYQRPEGGGMLASAVCVAERPAAVATNDGLHRIADLDGAGRLDVVRYQGAPAGYYTRTGTFGGSGARTGFASFRPFEALPNVDFASDDVRFIDVTGDGRADLLVTEGELVVCYRSKGRAGFEAAARRPLPADERDAPHLVFSDRRSSIFTADMTGDGLTDIVRIEASRVCYWPNLGYGRFGPRVTMSNAPQLDNTRHFDAERIRLADLDGTGTTDLVYLGRDGVDVYLNAAGNTWTSARRVEGLPLPDSLSDLQVVDLLGRGTACLVWSKRAPGAQPRLMYVDPFGREDDEEVPPSAYKPHLLVRVRNNVGAETRIRYTPSTKFYLQARGTPNAWVTRLHFPVQVVDRIEHEDFVANVLRVQRFAYHDGYFDPREREFNGFGYVERWDEETYDQARGSGRFDDTPTGGLVGWVPPVYTRTWFHTGAWWAHGRVDLAALGRAHANPDGLPGLDPAVVPSGLSTRTAQRAHRALRGQLIREEVYGLDRTAQAGVPYVITENQVEVHEAFASPSVFAVLPRQTRTFASERSTTDVRVEREVTLDVPRSDAAYGHVRRAARVALGRSSGPAAQTRSWIVTSEADVEHHDVLGGVYRIRVPARDRSWEVTGAAVAADTPIEALRGVIAAGATRELSRSETLYYDPARNAERAAGVTDPRGFVRRVRTLAVDASVATATFGARTPSFDPAQWTEGGHTIRSADVWASSPVIEYLPDDAFALPFRSIDPFGEARWVDFDPHRLFAVRSENALGHVVTHHIDYHALAPAETIDPNLDHIELAYDPLGSVTAVARKGKDLTGGRWEGRTLAAPHTTYTYARREWFDRRRPVFVRSESFVSHDPTDPSSIVAVAYADGRGQTVVTKTQAAAGVAPVQDAATGALLRDATGAIRVEATNDRWIGSGRVVLNSKGDPLQIYEPYYSSVSAFDDESELIHNTPAAVLHYDPLGRLTRTQQPDGTEERVVRSTWSEAFYDRSDTAATSRWATDAAASPDPELVRAHALTLPHQDTPAVHHLDAMGRVFQLDADNGTAAAPAFHSTNVELDVEGRTLRVTDARGVVVAAYRYDRLGRVLHSTMSDSGSRWIIPAVDGQLVRRWDDRQHVVRATYDRLRRPVSTWVSTNGSPEVARTHVVYADALGAAAARTANLVGAAHAIYDAAGVRVALRADFDGQVIETDRRLRASPAARDSDAAWVRFAEGPDWSPLASAPNLAELRVRADALLEPETFHSRVTYDALGRPTEVMTPDASVTRRTFDRGGRLSAVDVRLRGAAGWSAIVREITYDPAGRRERIVYGNDVATDYDYDYDSRRLALLRTTRSDGRVLQALGYTYDAAGNVVAIRDAAQSSTFFDNAVVSSDRRFAYDARHRLVTAEGRCHPGQQPSAGLPPNRSVPHANDATTLVRYTESYDYDAVGNVLDVRHRRNGVVAWRRRYQYAQGSNRLVSTSAPGEAAHAPYFDPATSTRYADRYTHDAHGNLMSMPGLSSSTWDADDRLVAADLGGGGDAFYGHGIDGARARKIIRRPGGSEIVERLYLDGWELYRRRDDAGEIEAIETLHVNDDLRRVALVETRMRRERAVEATPSPRTRYQLDDHLGSATLEVDASAQARVLTYEEFGPYGVVTYRATRGGVDLSPKRYRYTTKERDEETGLDDFGQRLYASWLARWMSPDPAGLADGTNVYAYVRGSPMNLVDPEGLEGDLPVTAYPEPPKGEVSGDGIHVFPHPADDGTLVWLKREGGQTTDAATFAFLNENYDDILARVGGDEDVARRLTEAATAFNDYIESRLYAGENPVDARKRWLDVNLAEAAVHGFFFGGDPSSPDYDDSRSLIALGFNLLPTAFAMLAGMRSRPRRSSRRSARVVMERAFLTKDESQAPDSRGLFKNLKPEDKPQKVEFQTARVAEDGTVTGLTKIPDRPVEFVRMPDGELRMGRGGHIDLSNGDPVKFAGLIEVRRRADGSVYVLEWHNGSGHYRPGAAWAHQAGLPMNKFVDASRAFAMFRNPNGKVYRRSQLGR